MGKVRGITTKAIYETKGRAREYNELAINLYEGCTHGCAYCYGADVLQKDKASYYANSKARATIINKIMSDCYELANKEDRPILLCFVTDPYQPIPESEDVTRPAIMVLKQFGLKVIILTKGGHRAARDFDILQPGIDQFATTLTFMNGYDSEIWEPNAARPIERLRTLNSAHIIGLYTWVSLEPVIYPWQTIELIKSSHKFVDHYKVGTLNYAHKLPAKFQALLPEVDWRKFGIEAVTLLRELNQSFYIKDDLKKYLPKEYWE